MITALTVPLSLRALCVVPGEEELSRAGRKKAPRGTMAVLESYYQQLQSIRGNH